MAAKTSPHRVVILGAGFGGLRVAIELNKRFARTKGCEITLVDRNEGHVYWPLLYEVCSGALDDSQKGHTGALQAGVSIGLDEYSRMLRRKSVRYVRGSVSGVDQKAKEIILEDGQRIAYDDVVVALGAESATYGIPRIAEHAITMKSLSDAMKIRQRIATFLSAHARGEEKRISVCVGGAGPTGTELSAELANFFARLVSEGVLKRENYEIHLIEAGPTILAPYSEAFRARAVKRLKQLGVDVAVNMKILAVEKGKIRLAAPDGKESAREADVIVWTGGIKPFEFVKTLGIPVDEKGFVQIEPTFEIKGMHHAYALGDCAAVMNAKTGKRVPALGQAAVKEAQVVGENIVRHLERKTLVTWTPPEHWITVVPLGGKFALADFGSWYVSGTLGYALRKGADLLYLFSVLPFPHAFKMWARGTSVYMKND